MREPGSIPMCDPCENGEHKLCVNDPERGLRAYLGEDIPKIEVCTCSCWRKTFAGCWYCYNVERRPPSSRIYSMEDLTIVGNRYYCAEHVRYAK